MGMMTATPAAVIKEIVQCLFFCKTFLVLYCTIIFFGWPLNNLNSLLWQSKEHFSKPGYTCPKATKKNMPIP